MKVWVVSNGRDVPEAVFDNEFAAQAFANGKHVVPWPLEVSEYTVVSSVPEALATYGD